MSEEITKFGDALDRNSRNYPMKDRTLKNGLAARTLEARLFVPLESKHESGRRLCRVSDRVRIE
jgi:hypothetical protein